VEGYCLTQDTRQHKLILFIGTTRAGKGTIVKVLTSLIGENSVCCPTIRSLAGSFGLQPLDEQLAVITEARLSARTDQAVIAERLLSISGGDLSSVDTPTFRLCSEATDTLVAV
jgi:putative DNA primase/helicase